MIGEKSLIELCEAPKGYRFVRGLWATHDLNMHAMAEWIAPALVGSLSNDGRRRRIEARRANGECDLIVFHAADRLALGPTIPWVSVAPIAGRRLHAKFALLQFEAESKKKVVTRAIVTSANLTRDGLIQNREIVAWEDIGNRAEGPSLGASLVPLFRELAVEVKKEAALKKNKGILAVLEQIAEKIGGRSDPSLLCETVTNHSNRDLLGQLDLPAPARRVIILSPSFAGDTDAVMVKGLHRFIGKDTIVDLYLPASIAPGTIPSPQDAPMFSSSALATLRKHARKVRMFAVPESLPGEDGEKLLRTRTMHAKLIVLVGEDGKPLVLAGSANYTTRGLGGARANRETMICRSTSQADVDAMLNRLQAIPWPTEPAKPCKLEPNVDVPAPPLVNAVFEIDPGQCQTAAIWRGILKLSGDGVSKFQYLEKEYKWCATQEFKLLEDQSVIEVWANGLWWPIPVAIEAPDEFWTRIDAEDQPAAGPDDELDLLLFDIKTAGVRPKEKIQPGSTSHKQPDDSYHIPLEQRLVVLARKRCEISPGLQGAELRDLLERYIRADDKSGKHADDITSAIDCAVALLSAYDVGLPDEPEDELLRALGKAARSFDREKEQVND